MSLSKLRLVPVVALAGLLGACASDGGNGLFSTSSVVSPPAADPKPAKVARVDPQCVTLASQIETLRKDGTIDRLEKVAAGKGDNVQVKRTAIAKQAELNKVNAEFQSRCAPAIPASQGAAAPATNPVMAAAAPVAAAAVAKTPVAKAAQAAQSGVTVVPSAQPKTQ